MLLTITISWDSVNFTSLSAPAVRFQRQEEGKDQAGAVPARPFRPARLVPNSSLTVLPGAPTAAGSVPASRPVVQQAPPQRAVPVGSPSSDLRDSDNPIAFSLLSSSTSVFISVCILWFYSPPTAM